MTERGKGTCACERCGNRCHHQQSHCDSCQEVRRLREALGRLVASATVVETISLDPRTPGEQSESIEVGDRAFTLARKALEETPW